MNALVSLCPCNFAYAMLFCVQFSTSSTVISAVLRVLVLEHSTFLSV